jgi:hypothetical protein
MPCNLWHGILMGFYSSELESKHSDLSNARANAKQPDRGMLTEAGDSIAKMRRVTSRRCQGVNHGPPRALALQRSKPPYRTYLRQKCRPRSRIKRNFRAQPGPSSVAENKATASAGHQQILPHRMISRLGGHALRVTCELLTPPDHKSVHICASNRLSGMS